MLLKLVSGSEPPARAVCSVAIIAFMLVLSPGKPPADDAAASSDGLAASVGSIAICAAAPADVAPTLNTLCPVVPSWAKPAADTPLIALAKSKARESSDVEAAPS